MKNRPLISADSPLLRNPAARAALVPLSYLYYIGYLIRRRKYERMPVTTLPAPVISVGNITVGGTGKTPAVQYLAKILASRGLKPGVCIRGYGRKGTELAVLDPAQPPPPWQQVGDEALLHLAAGIAVGIGADRLPAATALVKKFACDVILLDDGFQFRSLHRDLNIALVDATNPFGHRRLLPAGLLREPISCLAEADLFWITRANLLQPKKLDHVRHSLRRRFPGIPAITSSFQPKALRNLKSGKRLPAAEIKPAPHSTVRTISVSGIGNPAAFDLTIKSLANADPLPFRFRDHHPFTTDELTAIEKEAVRRGIRFIITTEKDAVRFPAEFEPSARWHVLEAEIEVSGEGTATLNQLLRTALEKK